MWGKTSSFRMAGPSWSGARALSRDSAIVPLGIARRILLRKAMDQEAALARVLAEVRACTFCAAHLPLGPRPVVRGHASARLLIVSQAPGTRVHETGLSFNDRSGDRLRAWLGIDRDVFYDESRVAVMGMGFCYPGRDA